MTVSEYVMNVDLTMLAISAVVSGLRNPVLLPNSEGCITRPQSTDKALVLCSRYDAQKAPQQTAAGLFVLLGAVC
jgi:hypothetical protein